MAHLSAPLIGLLLVALIGLASLQSEATKYSVCDPAKALAEVQSVKISDCESSTETCPFLRGFNKTIELEFVPKQKIEQAKVKITGKLSTVPLPFHVNPDNACGNYGVQCPLEAGKPYKFKLSLPILRTYPKISVDVFLRLVNENGDLIYCVEMPAQIQEPQKPQSQ